MAKQIVVFDTRPVFFLTFVINLERIFTFYCLGP